MGKKNGIPNLKRKINPIQVYTDGSFNISNNTGGFGAVFILGKRIKKHSSGQYVDTTNNRMELRGVIYALERCQTGHMIDIYCDSEYTINIANEWLDKWIEDGSIKKRANIDLLRKLYRARKKHLDNGSKLKFVWIRGHAGNTFNEMADKLAFVASLSGDPVVCRKR